MAPAKRAQKRPAAKKTAGKKVVAKKNATAKKSPKRARPQGGGETVVYSDVRRELREGLVGRLLGL